MVLQSAQIDTRIYIIRLYTSNAHDIMYIRQFSVLSSLICNSAIDAHYACQLSRVGKRRKATTTTLLGCDNHATKTPNPLKHTLKKKELSAYSPYLLALACGTRQLNANASVGILSRPVSIDSIRYRDHLRVSVYAPCAGLYIMILFPDR